MIQKAPEQEASAARITMSEDSVVKCVANRRGCFGRVVLFAHPLFRASRPVRLREV